MNFHSPMPTRLMALIAPMRRAVLAAMRQLRIHQPQPYPRFLVCVSADGRKRTSEF